jgi:hypothetical protein
VKDVPFEFDAKCLEAFETLKEKLVSAPIIVAPDGSLEFELMCDVGDYSLGAMLGQIRSKFLHAINYDSKVLNDAQINYATAEKSC